MAQGRLYSFHVRDKSIGPIVIANIKLSRIQSFVVTYKMSINGSVIFILQNKIDYTGTVFDRFIHPLIHLLTNLGVFIQCNT